LGAKWNRFCGYVHDMVVLTVLGLKNISTEISSYEIPYLKYYPLLLTNL